MNSLIRGRGWLFIIGGIALVVRLVYLVEVRGLPEFAVLVLDPHIHDTIARVIAGGDVVGNEVFFRAPLYLYFLGFLYFVFGPSPWSVRIFQVILGAAVSMLAYRIGRRCFSEWAGRIAGLVTALTWTLVYFDGEVLITTLITFLDLLLIDRLLGAAEKPTLRRWGIGGLILGLSAIARPTILVFGWLVVLWIVGVRGNTEPLSRRLRWAACYVLGSLLVITPVTVRNAVVGGDFVPIASQGGINFYLGNNPHASGWSATSPEIGRDWWGGFDDAVRIAEEESGRELRPSEVSRYWTRRGLEFWFERPAEAFRLGLRKLFFFWGSAELGNNRDIEFFRQESWVLRFLPFSFGWLVPLAILGALVGGRRRDRFLLTSFVVLYMATVVLFFVCARFRMPVVPVLAILASGGGVRLAGEIRSARVGRSAAALLGIVLVTAFLRLDLARVRDPMHTQSFFNRGLVESRMEDDASAEQTYLEALERDPNYVDALINLGGLYTRQGRWKEARALFERVRLLEPENPTAVFNLGVVSERSGDVDGAESRYRAALDRDSHHLPAKVGLAGILESRGELNSARALYEEALREYRGKGGLGPGEIRVRFEEEAASEALKILTALGRINDRQGYLGPALEHYREAMDLAPDLSQAHYRVGYVLLRMGRHEEAAGEFKRELERFPEDLSARYALGLSYARAGSVLPAIREFRAVLEVDPNHDRAWQNLGVLYARNESYDEAIRAFEEALRINPNNRQANLNLESAREFQSR